MNKKKYPDVGDMNRQLNIVFESRVPDGAGGKKGPRSNAWRSNVWCSVKPWKTGVTEILRDQHFQDSELLTFEIYYDDRIDKSTMMIEFPAGGNKDNRKQYRIIEMINLHYENWFLKLNCVEQK